MSPSGSRAALVGALVTLAVAAPSSWADDYPAPLRECAHDGTVLPGHAPAEIQAAIRAMPADVAEYTDCRDQLEAALAEAVSPSRAPAQHSPAPAGIGPYGDDDPPAGGGAPAAVSPGAAELAATVAAAAATPQPSPTPAPDPTDTGATSPAVKPFAQPVGSLAAAGIIGASLLALGRPAMLRRRRAQGE